MFAKAARHLKIVGALMMREMATRFGREGLGFAWIVGEPLLFCFGVMILWSFTKSPYEHGIRLAPVRHDGLYVVDPDPALDRRPVVSAPSQPRASVSS